MSVTVVGGTIAALVAADELARQGTDVELLLPNRGVGGGFAPMERGGRRLELGIRVFELQYEGGGEPPPLAEYEAGEYGHRPFARLIERWVRELAGDGRVVELPRPAMVLDGKLASEVLLTSDLSRLRDVLGAGELATMASEARAAADALGDAGLLAPDQGDALWRTSLDEASVANHGLAFHRRLIAPLAEKIRPEGASDVVAQLRRKLWLPLFWPRTVWEATSGAPMSFEPHRPFHSIEPGGTGEIVPLLMERIAASNRVTVTRHDGVAAVGAAPGGVRIELKGAREVVAERPVLGLAPGELFAAAGVSYAPDRVRSTLVWVVVREDDLAELPGFVHVIDPAFAPFRITPGERDAEGGRVLCVELRHDVAEEDAVPAARAVLEATGLLREGAEIAQAAYFSGMTFTAPTAAALAQFEGAWAAYQALELDAVVVGGAVAFGADAFNEQVVQGLQAAEARGG